jgi:catechol 2,3-dioxygenase-like lactoylglutathione lyase family enzyme
MNKLEHIGIAVKNLEESNKLFAKLLGKPHYKIEEVERQKAYELLFLMWVELRLNW